MFGILCSRRECGPMLVELCRGVHYGFVEPQYVCWCVWARGCEGTECRYTSLSGAIDSSGEGRMCHARTHVPALRKHPEAAVEKFCRQGTRSLGELSRLWSGPELLSGEQGRLHVEFPVSTGRRFREHVEVQ